MGALNLLIRGIRVSRNLNVLWQILRLRVHHILDGSCWNRNGILFQSRSLNYYGSFIYHHRNILYLYCTITYYLYYH